MSTPPANTDAAAAARTGAPGQSRAGGRGLRAGASDMVIAAVAGGVLVLAGNLVAEFTAFEWTLWAIEVILALSLVLVWGHCGIFSFGQAAVYGVGGYAYGVFALNVADHHR